MAESDKWIAVVGPCASGKSTLVTKLREHNVPTRMPAQEHSYIPDMWNRIVHPEVLIYLDADDETLRSRRSGLTDEYLARERELLQHAREHADLVIDTSDLTPDEVLDRTRTWLKKNIETRDTDSHI